MMYTAAVFILASLLPSSWAFSSGARNNGTMEAFSSYCTSGNFRPNHGNFLPQYTAAPYLIRLSSPAGGIYRPGQVVTITIEGKRSPALQKFKGFFIQGDSTEASFAGDITCGNQGQKVNFCGKPGATHKNGHLKQRVVCKWTPPDFQIGRVQFVATIVANFSTFWTGVKSSTKLAADPNTMTYEQKAVKMREEMMRQFQSGAQGFMNMARQQSGGTNPFAAMVGGAGGGQQNPFASLLQQAQQRGRANLPSQFSQFFNSQ